MYTAFFNLKRKPFELSPDPEFLLLSKAHKRAMLNLSYGMSENAGFILITGEVGTGKTTIIRHMMKGLQEDVRLARVNNTKVSSEQLIAMINEDFGLAIKGKDKTGMLSELSEFLIEQYAQGRRSMIIIDEAQNLSPDLLEEIRLLSNLETDRSKLVQIILVGQPELAEILASPGLRQLRQRISIRCHIQPLSREETEAYIFHRLEVAGNRGAVTFQDGTIGIVHNFSRGIPRLINIFCDFLMLSAFGEEIKEISPEFVREIVGELETIHGYWDDKEPKRKYGYAGNAADLKDVLNRLERLEVSQYRAETVKMEWEELSLRLKDKERVLDGVLNQMKTELAGMDMKNIHAQLDHLLKELEALKERLPSDEEKHPPETESNGKRKKNLWERMFNTSTKN